MSTHQPVQHCRWYCLRKRKKLQLRASVNCQRNPTRSSSRSWSTWFALKLLCSTLHSAQCLETEGLIGRGGLSTNIYFFEQECSCLKVQFEIGACCASVELHVNFAPSPRFQISQLFWPQTSFELVLWVPTHCLHSHKLAFLCSLKSKKLIYHKQIILEVIS